MRPDIRNLIASTGLFSAGYSMLIFTIPLFAVSVGSSQSELGFIALVYNLPSLFVPLVVGRFLDKTKAMRVIQIAMAAYALLTLLFPYGSTFLQVAAIRAVQGFVSVAFWVAIEKELADLASHGERGRIMGFYNVSWSAAFIVGPLLGGFLIEMFHFKTAFIVTFVWQAAALILLILLASRDNRGDAALAQAFEGSQAILARAWESGDLIAACFTSGMAGVILGVIFSLFSAYVTSLGFSPVWAGFFILLFSASRVATFLGVGPAIDRIGERKFMLTGMVLSVSVIILGSSVRAEFLALGLLVLGLGSGMTYTAALTLISRSPSKMRGSAIGKFEFSFSLGIALMAQAGGISADLFGPSMPYLLSGVVTLFGFVALLGLSFSRKRTRPTNPPMAELPYHTVS